jgi:hypothetical protein
MIAAFAGAVIALHPSGGSAARRDHLPQASGK